MMKTKVRFKKGDWVRVINLNNHFFNEVAVLLMFDVFTKKYQVQFSNGYKSELYHYELAKHLSFRELRVLYEAQLFQLADLALNVKDRDWFEAISKQLKEMKR